MAEQQQSPSGFKRMSLDKIIEAMTSDLESSNGHYVQFGVNPQQTTSHNWGNYSSNQTRHYIAGQPCHSNPPTMQSMPPMGAPLYMQDMSNYDSPTDSIYFPSQAVNHLGINENNDLIGTIDVGRGNYINVIYGNASQIMAEQCQLSNMTSYRNQNIIDREYGLFHDRHMNVPSELPTQNFNGKQLIENLVGNWVPNQSGTYSPFGGSPNVTPVLQPNIDIRDPEELPRNSTDFQHKKPRMVAEVKPMRPSYSDVLTKSAPTPPSPLTVQSIKPKTESVSKKVSNKNSKNKSKSTTLKRQNSSGSDDHNSPKIQIPRKVLEKNNSNLPRRWVSLDNLGSPTEVHEINSFDRSNQFEKKKVSKISKKAEKGETLNNSKVQNNNPKSTGNIPKRPIQINNNLNIINTSSETIYSEKIEKNQQVVNKVNKEEKKVTKEKNSKRFQVEKTQIKKAQRNRRRENRESPVKDLYKNLNKYASHWIKIGLKIFHWLLHLVSDVVSMSANLMILLGKCGWYHTILYLKYLWVYMAMTFSKIRILNAIGKQLDNWFGNSKFAFWRKIKTKSEEKEENSNWIHGGLEANIALPSTGEEAMKRLLACKGKDPYSILGVTPTCSDDDIKKYYKRQAFLVHPDKNNQPGAEEAFKILVHAFDIIGEPERRQAFDQTRQVEAAWGVLSDLLSQLHRKMEQAANTIRCTNCGLRHKRIPTQRPCYAARYCAQCKIRHGAKEGDIWAESRLMGFLWHYYACMEGAVYDVTDWAACQAGNLKHLRANTHSVQYRIVLGQRPPSRTANNGKRRQQIDPNTSEADFENFLKKLYNHTKTGNSSPPNQSSFGGDCKRRKTKHINQDELILQQQRRIEMEISESIALVGEKESIKSLEREYSEDEIYLSKAKALGQKYSYIRRTRPDGNCFFRAFSYAYLEKLIGNKEEYEKFRELALKSKESLVALGFPQFTVEDFHDTFMDVIDKVGEDTESSYIELHKLFNEQGCSDYVVVYLRLITSGQLRLEADFYQHFIEGERTVSEFCRQEVEPMYKESDHIHIIAMSTALGTGVRVRYMDRGAGTEVTAHDFPEGATPAVHLLYRPGHYDILYP